MAIAVHGVQVTWGRGILLLTACFCKYGQARLQMKNFRSHHPPTCFPRRHIHLSAKRWWKELLIKYFMGFMIAYLWRVYRSLNLSVSVKQSFPQQPQSQSRVISFNRCPAWAHRADATGDLVGWRERGAPNLQLWWVRVFIRAAASRCACLIAQREREGETIW